MGYNIAVRQNINRFTQRTDYTKALRSRPMAKAHSLDGVSSSAPLKRPPAPSGKRSTQTNLTSQSEKDHSTLSLSLSLPTLRRPPDAGEPPSRTAVRWVFITIFSAIFFIIGYHNIWHITHKSTLTPAAGLIRPKTGL
jgi:hypothetical protein